MLCGWVGRGRISDLCRLVGRVVEQDGDVGFFFMETCTERNWLGRSVRIESYNRMRYD